MSRFGEVDQQIPVGVGIVRCLFAFFPSAQLLRLYLA